ncbi:MFS transporter [Motilimonas pumila]|uniref:MFS transporter n=1 Tax=Motilimonas pumila TaxID=2303987 RepID=A0A418YGG3_9GAMM|nr:MFS transporter [Motilimonas pumila]RJG48707.1 MFS transporter [Motilimonas pumila]
MAIFSNQNFVLHWLGSSCAQLGGFFTLLALPWLVLQQTNNDAFQMSLVMASFSLPHSLLILFGGALADRSSPLKLLFFSRACFVIVMFMLAACVYLQFTAIGLLCGFGIALGTLSAFGIPASQALLPALCKPKELAAGNGILMATNQVAMMLGPLMAGWIIWAVRAWLFSSAINEQQSLAIAFIIDALLVSLSLILLLNIQTREQPKANGSVTNLVVKGIQYCWYDKGIRLVLGYLMLISFFMHGAILATLPIISKVHLGLSEAGYGTLYAMTGLGTLLGAGIAVFTKPSPHRLGWWVLICDGVSGLMLITLAQTSHLLGAVVTCLLTMGLCAGFIMVAGTTWFQQRTQADFMGRVMALLMFCILGLIPVSGTLAGWLVSHMDTYTVLHGAGVVIALAAVLGLLLPMTRNMGSISPLTAQSVVSLKLLSNAEPHGVKQP